MLAYPWHVQSSFNILEAEILLYSGLTISAVKMELTETGGHKTPQSSKQERNTNHKVRQGAAKVRFNFSHFASSNNNKIFLTKNNPSCEHSKKDGETRRCLGDFRLKCESEKKKPLERMLETKTERKVTWTRS